MPFEYLAKILSPGGSRLDRIEDRMRNIENKITKLSMTFHSGTEGEKKETERKKKKKARSVYTSEGWQIPKERTTKGGLMAREFGRDWIIEFECPNCGQISTEGVNHWDTKREDGHTKYGIYLDCKNCGWRSDLLNIRAFH